MQTKVSIMKQHILLSVFISSIFYASSFSMSKNKPAVIQSFTKQSFNTCCQTNETLAAGCRDCLETTIRLTESLQDEEMPACGLGGGAIIGACIVGNAFCKAFKNTSNKHHE